MSVKADFSLVGSGEAREDCGKIFMVGCLNSAGHDDISGKGYFEQRQNSCHRPLCPTCWRDWANREIKKAMVRLAAFKIKGRNLKPFHAIASVPHADWFLELNAMRQKVYRCLKKVRCFGGLMLYHPERQRADGSWYYSPHFHIIGYGWLVDVRANYIHSGYIVKNVGIRRTVEGTLFYQLSHCGISSAHHSVTWFGCLSYAKLHVDYPKEADVCPHCGEKLRKVFRKDGSPPLPDFGDAAVFYDDVKWWDEELTREEAWALSHSADGSIHKRRSWADGDY